MNQDEQLSVSWRLPGISFEQEPTIHRMLAQDASRASLWFGEKTEVFACADMQYVTSDVIQISSTIEVAHLNCAALISWKLLIVGIAVLLIWQRSLIETLRASFQGAGRFPLFTKNPLKSMDSEEDDSRKVPAFDGRLDGYRDYRRRAQLYFYYVLEDSKQSLAAPRLIANLAGPAFECFREKDASEFRSESGVLRMLGILDTRFQYTPEQEMSEWLETLFLKLRRTAREETTSFTARFEMTLSKTEDLITQELRQDRKRRQYIQKAEFRRHSHLILLPKS